MKTCNLISNAVAVLIACATALVAQTKSAEANPIQYSELEVVHHSTSVQNIAVKGIVTPANIADWRLGNSSAIELELDLYGGCSGLAFDPFPTGTIRIVEMGIPAVARAGGGCIQKLQFLWNPEDFFGIAVNASQDMSIQIGPKQQYGPNGMVESWFVVTATVTRRNGKMGAYYEYSNVRVTPP